MTVAAEASPRRKVIDLDAWRYFESRSPGRLGVLLVYGLVALLAASLVTFVVALAAER